MKYVLTLGTALTLSACMSLESGDEVSRAATGVDNCAHLGGMAATYMQGTNVRCGPQSQLPYTLQ